MFLKEKSICLSGVLEGKRKRNGDARRQKEQKQLGKSETVISFTIHIILMLWPFGATKKPTKQIYWKCNQRSNCSNLIDFRNGIECNLITLNQFASFMAPPPLLYKYHTIPHYSVDEQLKHFVAIYKRQHKIENKSILFTYSSYSYLPMHTQTPTSTSSYTALKQLIGKLFGATETRNIPIECRNCCAVW